MNLLYLEDLKQGMEFRGAYKMALWRIILMALASGDWNSIHWNPIVARQRLKVKGIVAHGVLVGYVSQMVGRGFFADGNYLTEIHGRFRGWVGSSEILEIVLLTLAVNRRGRTRFRLTVQAGERILLDGEIYVWIPSATKK
ncbi:MAG: MaoC family dehydratase [bacterium]|nr:MaoC family dehydratase [bacterium]